jgi:hypothetical protein
MEIPVSRRSRQGEADHARALALFASIHATTRRLGGGFISSHTTLVSSRKPRPVIT